MVSGGARPRQNASAEPQGHGRCLNCFSNSWMEIGSLFPVSCLDPLEVSSKRADFFNFHCNEGKRIFTNIGVSNVFFNNQ